jgi:hypothetical protein
MLASAGRRLDEFAWEIAPVCNGRFARGRWHGAIPSDAGFWRTTKHSELWGFHLTSEAGAVGIAAEMRIRPGPASVGWSDGQLTFCKGFIADSDGWRSDWNRKRVGEILGSLQPGWGKHLSPMFFELRVVGVHHRCGKVTEFLPETIGRHQFVHWPNDHLSRWMVHAADSNVSSVWIDLGWRL